MTQPRQTIASWPPFSASASAATGSSSEPGTQKTSGSLTPCSSSAASAPRRSLFDTSSLNRATTTAMVRLSPLRSGLAPFSPTALQKVSELVFLGLQVALVVGIGFDADRDALDDLQTESFESVDLLGVVRQQPDLPHAEVVDDLAADAVVPFVWRVAEGLVRLDGIEARVLEVVGVKLVEQADATTFLVAYVEDHAGTVGGDHFHGGVQLRAAVASEAAEDVAGEAFRVGAEENRLCRVDVAEDEREVVLMSEDVLIGIQLPHARLFVADGDGCLDAFRDQLFVAAPVGDELFDGDELDSVLDGESLELRHASHGAIGLHELGDHSRGIEAREDREVDGGFGLAGTGQHTAFGRAKRKGVSGRGEVGGFGRRVEDLADGGGSVIGRGASCRHVLGVDAHAERRTQAAGVVLDHG